MNTWDRRGGLAFLLLLVLASADATITYNAGTNLITLDDSVGAGDSWGTCYDEDDIVANCGAVATKQGTNAYDISARLYFADGVYFCSKNSFVELKPNPTNPSYTIFAAAGSHIRIGNYNSGDGYSYNGAFWRIYTQANSGSQTNRFNGELLVYGSNIWTDATDYPKGLHFVKGAKIRLYNSVHRHPSYFWAVDTDIQNVKWDGTGGSYDMLVASGPNFNWAGLTTSACQKGIFFSSTTTSSVDVYDFKPLNAGTDVYVSTGINSAHLIRIINSPLAITCSNPGAGKQGVQFCYAFNVKVTNDAGNPIVGATVSLKDVDGNDAFTPENTVAGGVLASDKIVKWYWFRNAADGGNKDYNDHTLKVVSGAEETEYKIKIDHQIKEDIILIPQSTASYDNIMDSINEVNNTLNPTTTIPPLTSKRKMILPVWIAIIILSVCFTLAALLLPTPKNMIPHILAGLLWFLAGFSSGSIHEIVVLNYSDYLREFHFPYLVILFTLFGATHLLYALKSIWEIVEEETKKTLN